MTLTTPRPPHRIQEDIERLLSELRQAEQEHYILVAMDIIRLQGDLVDEDRVREAIRSQALDTASACRSSWSGGHACAANMVDAVRREEALDLLRNVVRLRAIVRAAQARTAAK